MRSIYYKDKYQINICSLKKHFDELCIIIDNMETKFEVIVFTEAWLGLENVSINNLNEWLFNSLDYKQKNSIDGVVVYLFVYFK